MQNQLIIGFFKLSAIIITCSQAQLITHLNGLIFKSNSNSLLLQLFAVVSFIVRALKYSFNSANLLINQDLMNQF